MQRLPIPPFTKDTALAKVQAAEDVWNTRNTVKVLQLCSPDCVWRNREDTYQGRAAIEYFLKGKWLIESGSGRIKELWAFTGNRISVRFECEWQHAKTGEWFRTHGNEHWEFNGDGYMSHRDISANDVSIAANDRRIGRQFQTQNTKLKGRP